MKNGGYLATRIALLTMAADKCRMVASSPCPEVPGLNHYSVSLDRLRSLLSFTNTEKTSETSANPKF